MTLTFIGHGYVGLVTAAIFSDLGNTVWIVGHTKEKIDNLKKGIIPIFEPGLEELVKTNIKAGRLHFSLDYSSVPKSDVVFIAVGTPSTKTGDADLSTVLKVAEEVGKNLGTKYTVIATKSTVPVGTYKKIKQIIEEIKPKGAQFDIASVPEFLREGTAISDTLHPDRIVVGTEDDRARNFLVELHKPIKAPFVLTNLATAELIKYASNSFLATKISFANSIAKLSELSGANALQVLAGMGMDERIGKNFLSPGPGYGGSCFPKDVKALISIAKDYDYSFSLLEEVENINDRARRDVVQKARKMLSDLRNKSVAVLGLSFKPDTDDMRDAPAVTIIELLQKDGAKIKAYDPQAMSNARKLLTNVEFCKDPYEACKNADLLIIVTEWNEFKEMNLKKIKETMKEANIIDSRNIFEPLKIERLGFKYIGVGR